MNLFVITIDKEVHQKERQGIPSWHERYRDVLRSMVMGDSFFLKDETEQSVEPLIRYASRIDIQLTAESTDSDEVYHQPGVRVWKGNFADKSRNGQPGNRFFIDVLTNEPYALVGASAQRNDGDVEISQSDFVTQLHNWRQIVRERKPIVNDKFNVLMIAAGCAVTEVEDVIAGPGDFYPGDGKATATDAEVAAYEDQHPEIIYWRSQGAVFIGNRVHLDEMDAAVGDCVIATKAEYEAFLEDDDPL